MERAKMRKALAKLPVGLPPSYLEKALEKVHNTRTRARLKIRYQAREAAR